MQCDQVEQECCFLLKTADRFPIPSSYLRQKQFPSFIEILQLRFLGIVQDPLDSPIIPGVPAQSQPFG